MMLLPATTTAATGFASLTMAANLSPFPVRVVIHVLSIGTNGAPILAHARQAVI